MALDQGFSRLVNDYFHGVQSAAPTLTTTRKTKLCSTTGTSTTAGTEITAGGGYTSGGATTAYSASTTATPTVASNQAVSVTNMPAATVTSIETTDTTATPVRIEYGALTASKTTNSGDTLSFSSGAIQSSLQ